MEQRAEATTVLAVSDLALAFGATVILQDLNFTVRRGDVFMIMGPSGCGKSTLLRHLLGLQCPSAGSICYNQTDLWSLDEDERNRLLRHLGVLYQGGALWSSLTVGENLALPLHHFTTLGGGRSRPRWSSSWHWSAWAAFGTITPLS